MKKILILGLTLLLAFPMFSQGRIQNYKNAYLWGQSNRNRSDRGSVLSIKDGRTYALADVVKRTSPKAIDLMLFYGRPSSKEEVGFRLFAPNNPKIQDINFDKSKGTIPFRYFEASSKDPHGDAWLKNWTVRNATKMHKIEGVDFDNATAETMGALEVREEYMTDVLKEGDIVVFETAATSATPGKKGLIKIGAVEEDDRDDKEGQGAFQKLNLHIKVQR